VVVQAIVATIVAGFLARAELGLCTPASASRVVGWKQQNSSFPPLQVAVASIQGLHNGAIQCGGSEQVWAVALQH
jgi:hypothetical protein